jgi:hypothetical protein
MPCSAASRLDYTHFNAGATVKQAGGTDVDFVMFSAAYRF